MTGIAKNGLRSRVFISCGQHSLREVQIALRIAQLLDNRGFEPYIAKEVKYCAVEVVALCVRHAQALNREGSIDYVSAEEVWERRSSIQLGRFAKIRNCGLATTSAGSRDRIWNQQTAPTMLSMPASRK